MDGTTNIQGLVTETGVDVNPERGINACSGFDTETGMRCYGAIDSLFTFADVVDQTETSSEKNDNDVCFGCSDARTIDYQS